MRKHTKILVLFLFISFWSCEKAEEEKEIVKSHLNTLSQDLTGNKMGHINDYFYDFENNVNAQFFRYNPSLMKNYNSYSISISSILE